MSDRVTDGKKTLLVDEVQSDWHQAGRELGYKGDFKPVDWNDPEYVKARRDSADATNAFNRASENPTLQATLRAEMDRAREVELSFANASNKINRAVPNAPYKEDWYQLALRRAVKEAIDGGYDRVALPTGARVNERFDLSKQADGVFWNPEKKELTVKTKNGDYAPVAVGISDQEISKYVGKDVAKRLLSTDKENIYGMGNVHSLLGEDLTVGGEGNKKYYDEIYPNYLKKFGKKYGATVGTTGVEVPPDSKAAYQKLRQYEGSTEYINGRITWSEFLAQHPEAAKDFTEPLHYMDITPAMRKEFSTGIHMKKGGKVSFANSLDAMRHELTKAK
jgi:hypothetical protein